ncbi:hypothetical protein HY251_08720, partial [bacterium]|nr:hypothetical protein [bacterium]
MKIAFGKIGAGLLALVTGAAFAHHHAAPPPAPAPIEDDSKLVESSIPGSLSPGDRVTVTVSFENTGTKDWSYPDVKLGAEGDDLGDAHAFLAAAGGDGGRVWLSPGETIPPGSSKDFVFDIVAPGAGTYSPHFRMVREGIHWFGAATTATVSIGTPAPPPSPRKAPPPPVAPKSADAAAVLAVDIPTKMDPLGKGTFTVIMRNDGLATWDDGYRLGVVGDLSGDGARFIEGTGAEANRVHLADGATVPPGGTYTFSFAVKAPSTPSHAYDVKLRMVHEGVSWFGETAEQVVVTGTTPPVVFPSYDAMRKFRGDLSGMRIPEIKPFGKTDCFFTDVYPAYPEDLRATIRKLYKEKSYTHLPIAIRLGDYHGLYPTYDFIDDVKGFRAILTELWNDGLIPVVFVIDDTLPAQTPADMDAIKAKYTSFLTAVKDLVYIVVPGWEINAWMSPKNMTASCKWLKETLPDALVYIHFTSGHAAGSGDGESESGWWTSMEGVLMGILYQHDGTEGGDAVAARLSDFTIRFQTGFHFWPKGFDVVAFEYSAYWQTNEGKSEDWGNAIGDAAYTKTSPSIQGYCDGGTMPIAGPLPPCPWLPARDTPPPVGGSGESPSAPSPSSPSPSPSGGTDDAKVASTMIAKETMTGMTVAFTVVVENTGTSTWSDDFRLGVVDDMSGDAAKFLSSSGEPNRVHLAPGKTVAPGESYSFMFTG